MFELLIFVNFSKEFFSVERIMGMWVEVFLRFKSVVVRLIFFMFSFWFMYVICYEILEKLINVFLWYDIYE